MRGQGFFLINKVEFNRYPNREWMYLLPGYARYNNFCLMHSLMTEIGLARIVKQ